MSDVNDPRVPEEMGTSDADRREFGRQLAMDNILAAAHQTESASSTAAESAAESAVESAAVASAMGPVHTHARSGLLVAAAAAVVIGIGAWTLSGFDDPDAKPSVALRSDRANEHIDGTLIVASSGGLPSATPHGLPRDSKSTADPDSTSELNPTLPGTTQPATQPAKDPRVGPFFEAFTKGGEHGKSQVTTVPEVIFGGQSGEEVAAALKEIHKYDKGETVSLTEDQTTKLLTSIAAVSPTGTVAPGAVAPGRVLPTGTVTSTGNQAGFQVNKDALLVLRDGRSGKTSDPYGYYTRRVQREQIVSDNGVSHQAGVTVLNVPDQKGSGIVPTPLVDRLARINAGKRLGESYDHYFDNTFAKAVDHGLSTFSIDVDTASYSNIRDLLSRGETPSADSVRTEELINYFDYGYAEPTGEHPLAIHVDMARAPWAPNHHLVRIGLQARKPHGTRPKANLVFLLDVSGSMSPENKLPLLKACMKRLVEALDNDDRIAIVVYAGAAGLVLDSTEISESAAILTALDNLKSGGSTNGGAGIDLAYQVAQRNFIDNGINRVILATDGDFNVGVSDRASLITMIEKKRETGIFLSVLGFGRGNLRDSQMEQIANKGNGTYHYIDSLREGHRVLVRKLDASLITIAKDVKIQVEFNPLLVRSYRLIGYANRMLAKEDFNNDQKDAGEVGSGHTVTALYEVVPVDAPEKVDALRYGPKEQAGNRPEPGAFAGEMMFVKVRYKHPDGDTSTRIDMPFRYTPNEFADASDDFRFATAVAGFGMLLRNSQHKGTATYSSILAIAEGAMGEDADGYRNEFLQLVTLAQPKQSR